MRLHMTHIQYCRKCCTSAYIFSLMRFLASPSSTRIMTKARMFTMLNIFHLGPVVQSIVSLTNSLRVISLTILADSIYNILIFFAEKM